MPKKPDILKTEEEEKDQYFQFAQNKQYRHAEDVWHRLNQGTYIGDFVYGASDGIITTFAVIAGAAGAALSPGVIIILGLANLIADGFSMGASSFLSNRSEDKFKKLQRSKEEWEVEEFPEIEKEEVREILRSWGIPQQYVEPSMEAIVSDKERWIDLMMKEELDIVEEAPGSSFQHGLATFAAFVVAGALPLIPYIFFPGIGSSFMIAATLAGIAFFGIGAARSFITSEHPLRAGLEILFVGGVASAVAFVIGWAVKTGFGIAI